MGATHKPRKRHIPKRVDFDPIELAIARTAKLTQHVRLQFTKPMDAALLALKTGHGTMQHWCDLADALNVAERLCDVGICNDHRHRVLAGQQALGDLYERHAARHCWTLRGEEVCALGGTADQLGAVEVHRIQLQHCSQGELHDSIAAAVRHMRQALAGNAPADARVCVGVLGHHTPTTPPMHMATP